VTVDPYHVPVKMRRRGRRCYKGFLLRTRPGGALIAFVPHPDRSGAWVRTDGSVLFQECPVCKMPVGVPCRSEKGVYWSSSVHWKRRTDEFRLRLKREKPLVAIDIDTRDLLPLDQETP